MISVTEVPMEPNATFFVASSLSCYVQRRCNRFYATSHTLL